MGETRDNDAYEEELRDYEEEEKAPDSNGAKTNGEAGKKLTWYKGFKEGHKRILVATDLVGGGIDTERVNLVINYDMPDSADTCLHRVEQAKQFGTKGLAITFVSSASDSQVLNQEVTIAHGHNIYNNTRPSHLEEENEEVPVSNQKERCKGVIRVHKNCGNNNQEQNSGNGSNGSSNIGMENQNQLTYKCTTSLVLIPPHQECPKPMIPCCQNDVMEYENCLNQTRQIITNDNHSDEIVLTLSLEPMKSVPRDFNGSASILPNSCGSNCEVSRHHQMIDLSPNVYDDQDRAFFNPRVELRNNLERETELTQLPEIDLQYSLVRSTSHGNYDNVYREFDITRGYDHDHPPTNSALCRVSNSAPIQVADHRQGSVQTQEFNNKKRKAWTEAEHMLFLEGLKRYGTGSWKKISRECVTTKNHIQIASHAQKYFKRQETPKSQLHEEKRRRRSIHDIRFP